MSSSTPQELNRKAWYPHLFRRVLESTRACTSRCTGGFSNMVCNAAAQNHPYPPTAISQFHNGHLLQKLFVTPLRVSHAILTIVQPTGTLELRSTLNHASTHCQSLIQEGDIITGTIDISHEHTHVVSAI